MTRVVLDTNVLVSSALGGALELILDKWAEDAIARNADVIVSGDSHLLDLKKFRTTPIITAREFMDSLMG